MVLVIVVSLFAGGGLALVVWYGWGVIENIGTMRAHRVELAAAERAASESETANDDEA